MKIPLPLKLFSPTGAASTYSVPKVGMVITFSHIKPIANSI